MIKMLARIIKKTSLGVALLAFATIPFNVVGQAQAQGIQEGLCSGIELDPTGGSACGDADSNNKGVSSTISSVINILSILVGVVAVIMVLFGGFKYITSGGDSGKVTSAKNTIVYALIGLVIAALAQVIVRFVLAKATATGDAASGGGGGGGATIR